MAETVDLGRIDKGLKLLSEIEAKLNRKLASGRFRKELFADPVKVLKEEGVVVPEDREQSVVELFKSASVSEDADLRLSSALAPEGIFISIGIRF